MLKQMIKPAALRRCAPHLGGAAALTGGIAWYARKHYTKSEYTKLGKDASVACGPSDAETFKLKVEKRSKLHYHDYILLPEQACNDKLNAAASSSGTRRMGGMHVKWDSVLLGSNSPCEDRYAVDVIDKGKIAELHQKGAFWTNWADIKKASPAGDDGNKLLMFSMIDGHSGRELAQMLKSVVHATLAFGLSHSERVEHRSSSGVMKTIADTLTALNSDLLRLPMTLIRDHLEDANANPLLPHPSPALAAMAGPELAGACMTNAIVDIANDRLYVSNLGDTRAVAGWWNPQTSAWRCDVLTDIGDGSGANPLEAERVRGLHPEAEREDVIQNGRIYGWLAPTRVMGDNGYRRPSADREALSDALDLRYTKPEVPMPTPPYTINEVDIVCRDLHPESGEQLKFVILATDGVWDWLSSEEAALLMAGHSNMSQGSSIAKAELPAKLPFATVENRPFPAADLPGTTEANHEGTWVFKDENAALHLVRNALGRGNEWELRRLLSLQGGLVRWIRDDVTAMVVQFDEDETPGSI